MMKQIVLFHAALQAAAQHNTRTTEVPGEDAGRVGFQELNSFIYSWQLLNSFKLPLPGQYIH